MNTHQPTAPAPKQAVCPQIVLTEKQREELADNGKQKQYQQEYLTQLRQQQCPGCGETALF